MANEITEAVLMSRLRSAMAAVMEPKEGKTLPPISTMAEEAYVAGNFHEFVGVVGVAVQEERTRASHVARRLGHSETARKIAEG